MAPAAMQVVRAWEKCLKRVLQDGVGRSVGVMALANAAMLLAQSRRPAPPGHVSWHQHKPRPAGGKAPRHLKALGVAASEDASAERSGKQEGKQERGEMPTGRIPLEKSASSRSADPARRGVLGDLVWAEPADCFREMAAAAAAFVG